MGRKKSRAILTFTTFLPEAVNSDLDHSFDEIRSEVTVVDYN